MVDFLYRFHFSTLTWNWNEAMTIFVKNSERLADFFLNVTVMYLPGLDCCIYKKSSHLAFLIQHNQSAPQVFLAVLSVNIIFWERCQMLGNKTHADQIFSKNPYIFDRNSNRNLVISQTNSLKLIAPFPSWSISLISS